MPLVEEDRLDAERVEQRQAAEAVGPLDRQGVLAILVVDPRGPGRPGRDSGRPSVAPGVGRGGRRDGRDRDGEPARPASRSLTRELEQRAEGGQQGDGGEGSLHGRGGPGFDARDGLDWRPTAAIVAIVRSHADRRPSRTRDRSARLAFSVSGTPVPSIRIASVARSRRSALTEVDRPLGAGDCPHFRRSLTGRGRSLSVSTVRRVATGPDRSRTRTPSIAETRSTHADPPSRAPGQGPDQDRGDRRPGLARPGDGSATWSRPGSTSSGSTSRTGPTTSTTATLAAIRAVADEAGRSIAVLQDLGGPKIRLGPIPGDAVECRLGDEFALVDDRTVRRPPPAHLHLSRAWPTTSRSATSSCSPTARWRWASTAASRAGPGWSVTLGGPAPVEAGDQPARRRPERSRP